MAYSLYDAAVTPCAQQLGALAGIIDKAAAHCAANKIEELALLQDRLYPDMFCLARQILSVCGFRHEHRRPPRGHYSPGVAGRRRRQFRRRQEPRRSSPWAS